MTTGAIFPFYRSWYKTKKLISCSFVRMTRGDDTAASKIHDTYSQNHYVPPKKPPFPRLSRMAHRHGSHRSFHQSLSNPRQQQHYSIFLPKPLPPFFPSPLYHDPHTSSINRTSHIPFSGVLPNKLDNNV